MHQPFGENSAASKPQAQKVLAAGQAAGMDVQLPVLPGRHTWQVRGPGLQGALPWLSTRLGLTS